MGAGSSDPVKKSSGRVRAGSISFFVGTGPGFNPKNEEKCIKSSQKMGKTMRNWQISDHLKNPRTDPGLGGPLMPVHHTGYPKIWLCPDRSMIPLMC